MFATYCRLHLPTFASDIAVIRAMRARFQRTSLTREFADLRKACYRQMLSYHHAAQATCLEARI